MADVPVAMEDLQGDARWMSMHCRYVSEAKEREPEVVFVGDSLVFGLQFTPTWQKYFAPLHALNFGIGGDQTGHVLWRVLNGEMDNFCPKVVVLLVGTNNFGHTPKQICDGVMAIVDAIRQLQPQTFTIVMGLLPRGERPNPLRQRNETTNVLLSERLSGVARCQLLADYRYLMAAPDNRISAGDMADYLHLTPQGYAKVFEPVSELIVQLLSETDGSACDDVDA